MNRLIPTRWSHLLSYSGVGALVRADDDLYVVKDIGHWTDRHGEPTGEPLAYVDLLRATLGIDRELRRPPLARQLPNGAVDGVCVPALRFPRWTRCPSCGLLHWSPWPDRRSEEAPSGPPRCRCDQQPRLQQVDWVVAHPEGGLHDLPWHFLTHQDPRAALECREDRTRPSLRLLQDHKSGLRWTLTCDRCRTRTGFDPGGQFAERSPQRQPWQASAGRPAAESQQRALILEVNDARLYYPRASAALVIPPESRIRRGSVLDLLYCDHTQRTALQQCRFPLERRSKLRRLADRYACTPGEVEAAWQEIENGWPLYGQPVTTGGLLAKEYQALIQPIPDLDDGEDFVPRHKIGAWRALPPPPNANSNEARALRAVDRLVAVTRLREVRVFRGFTRVTQSFEDGLRPSADQSGPRDEPRARLVPPDLDGSRDWLPAIELYGEGIFFTLNEGMLARWAQQPDLQSRTDTLQRRLERTGMRFSEDPPLPLRPRFILLHTLAHLLIRQLESGAGYPAASIRERIYCAEGPEPMAGILVYVAVPDLVGSLGGLAELAEPRPFLRLLASVFAHADWCSLDPVCSEHAGQGPSQLNLAACHACALVPETSCTFGNLLLDRSFVKGDLQGSIRPLLAYATDTERD